MESFIQAIEDSELSQSDKELLRRVTKEASLDCSSLSQDGVELAFSCLVGTPNVYSLYSIITTNVYSNSPIEFIQKYKNMIFETIFYGPRDLFLAMNSFDDERVDFFLEMATENNIFLRYFYIAMMCCYKDPVKLKDRIAQKLPHVGSIADQLTFDHNVLSTVIRDRFSIKIAEKIRSRRPVEMVLKPQNQGRLCENVFDLNTLGELKSIYRISARVTYEDGSVEEID